MVEVIHMKNPLNHRLIRELRSEAGKYIVIFVFIAGMIGIVSGFLVANYSMSYAYNKGFEKYNIEDGNFELAFKADKNLTDALEKEGVTIYENFYIEKDIKENGSTLRIFKNRNEVNKACLMKGNFPENDNQIAIDRMYADNNKLSVGDTLTIEGKALEISGLVALSDYSALYSSPSDLMFDSIKFGVAVVNDSKFESLENNHLHLSYSWKYDDPTADKIQAKEMSEDLVSVISNKALILNFIPEYINQAIIFVGDDINKDSIMFTVFLYLVMSIIAFVFAIMTSNTISKEANVIGTLRASGYSKGELVRHYLTMPMVVVLVAALTGNILGYTIIKNYIADMYYGTYSIPTYVTLWNADAFVNTTIVPLILMFLINLIVLENKLTLSPLKFIKRDLKRHQKKKALKLNTKIGIMKRFRIRIILQNIPNYITIFIGIFLANVILLFGIGLSPLIEHYQDEITSNMICDYQYILKTPAETKTKNAEKYSADSLKTTDSRYKKEDVSIYGIIPDSKYIDIDFGNGVYISNAFSEKYGINKGDTVTLKDEYENKEYSFDVDGVYFYPSAIAVFMDNKAFCQEFGKDDQYFNGYFSNEEIKDVDDTYIATTITLDDMTKTSRQLKVSMGSIMSLFVGFGIIMFILIIYLLSKIIIEKNAQSISMTKILGYKGSEISGLYVLSTAIVVILSVLITIPICNSMISYLFKIIFSSYSGWFPYYIPFTVFIKMAAMGIGAYAAVAVCQMARINHISKSDALKNAE